MQSHYVIREIGARSHRHGGADKQDYSKEIIEEDPEPAPCMVLVKDGKPLTPIGRTLLKRQQLSS